MGIEPIRPKPTDTTAAGNCRVITDFVSRALAVAIMVLTILSVSIQAGEAKFASMVIDADTGKVLHQVNPDTRNYPASLTKMMTLYKIFERVDQGKWSMATRIRISARAARQPASRLGLRAGDMITVEEAILSLITKSANDIATAVAEGISGRERDFALKMTATARRLGMRSTTFRNASGLPHRGQMSTARDMARLARALMRDFPHYYHYFSTPSFEFRGATHKNHNKLLKSYPGADGLKTGYIRASGFNLVASAARNGQRVIGIIFGGRSSTMRNRLMVNLLDKGFRLTSGRAGLRITSAAPPAPIAATAKTALAAEPKREAEKSTKTPTASKHAWGIQVGAFAKQSQARSAAENVASKLPSLMTNGRIAVVPLQKRNGRTLHRARIHGLTQRQAYRACKLLKDCLQVRLADPLEVASAAR